MIRKTKTIAVTILLLAVYCAQGRGQAPQATILRVDVENLVQYFDDISDVTKFATNPNITAATLPKNFAQSILIGDIVAVNGQTARGMYADRLRAMGFKPAPNPGDAIADTNRSDILDATFEILNVDGTQIGTIVSLGLGGGSPPPGHPLAQTRGNNAIVGGTGAFLGARGEFGGGVGSQSILPRVASTSEDPANRRKNGGGRVRFVLHVIPMFRPEIVVTDDGPAIFHTDNFTQVTPANPAHPGELLTLFSTGLGPTRPAIDPGQPFPFDRPSVVNSPVEVTVNELPADVLSAIGVSGRVDTFEVKFKIPEGAAQGWTDIRLTAAWIQGPVARILVVPN